MSSRNAVQPVMAEALRGVPKAVIRGVDPADALHESLIAAQHPRWQELLIAFDLLDSYLQAATNQQRRVDRAMAPVRGRRRSFPSLFAEIHFGLICWSRIAKLMRFVTEAIVAPRSRLVWRCYYSRLQDRVKARDHLEHLEDRLPGSKNHGLLKDPLDLLNLERHVLTYGGSRIDVGGASMRLLRTIVREWRDAVRLDALEALAKSDTERAVSLLHRARNDIRTRRMQGRLAREMKQAQGTE